MIEPVHRIEAPAAPVHCVPVQAAQAVGIVPTFDPCAPGSSPCGPVAQLELTPPELLVRVQAPTIAEQYDPFVLAQVAGAYSMYRTPRTRV